MSEDVRLMLGDCLDRIVEIEDDSIDTIICDPPYPCIDRPYGRMTEAEWDAMMRRLIPECRRVLKPSGSAVFILQPNSERVGRMRPWLFEFQAWICREWNMVQDAYWWNTSALPTAGAPDKGMMRQSVKHCVWAGPPDCYRDQDAILWGESDRNLALRIEGRATVRSKPSQFRTGTTPRLVDDMRMHAAAGKRGGVTPFNLIPLGCGRAAGEHGHPAGTPIQLCDYWTRYISPPGGTVLDPFVGSGTTGLAALKRGRKFVEIERDAGYFEIARKRLQAASLPMFDASPVVVAVANVAAQMSLLGLCGMEGSEP